VTTAEAIIVLMLRSQDPDVAAVLSGPRSGWLYAIVAPELSRVKIGHAQSVDHRLDGFRTGAPCHLALHSATLEEDVRAAEAAAHRALKHARQIGEWFDMADPRVDEWLQRRERELPENGLWDRYVD
jgi:hypothetical protein